jgi:glucose/arabinose dehydrogenase/chitodextrinase
MRFGKSRVMAIGGAVAMAAGLLAVVTIPAQSKESAPDTQPPSAPQKLRQTGVTPTTISLEWEASTDNVGVAKYEIFEFGNSLGETDDGETTKFVAEGLKSGKEYGITVFATDAAGNTSQSSERINVRTPKKPTDDPQKPTAPTKLTVTGAAADSVSLSWTAATDNVGVVGYDIYNGDTALVRDAEATSATVTELVPETPYTFTVRAKDAAGNESEPSNAVKATTKPGGGGGGGGDGGSSGAPSGIKEISTDWSIPWGMTFLPDGSALVSERDKFTITRVSQDGKKTPVGKIDEADTTDGEGGLLGLAVSPKFAQDKMIFIYHTSKEGDNRVVKATLDGNKLGERQEVLTGIRKNRFHNGGRIKFGPDGFLYVTTGDAQQKNLAQDRKSLNGKILRITMDGKPAPGNPFDNEVYSMGHRNPQGLAWDSAGRLWESEFGNSEKDELNLIEAGKNFGWPECEGECSKPGMTNPKQTWDVGDASPSGIAIVGSDVYMAALRGQRLWKIPINGTNAGKARAYFVNEYGRLRTVEKLPKANALWLSTTNADGNGKKPEGSDRIFRVEIK